MILLKKPNEDFIARWIESQTRLQYSYEAVFCTREEKPPGGFNVDRYSVRLGLGEETYQRAVAAIRGLRMWDFNWLQLHQSFAPVQEGSVLATLTYALGMWFLNPCRVVYIREETAPRRRFSFAYGTLEGHVEAGEERFMVEWREDNTVWYEITSYSRPAHWLMYPGYPYLRKMQRKFGASSLQAIVRAVKEESLSSKSQFVEE